MGSLARRSGATSDERGQTIPEYALILAGLALLVAISLLFLSSNVANVFHRSSPQQPVMRPPSGVCDPSYSGACIPSPPPDLDCSDLSEMGITGVVRVMAPDPHHLDPDHDGIACA